MSNEISKEEWEKHGQSKSALLKEFAKMIGVPVKNINVSALDVGELVPLPVIDEKTKTTTFRRPLWWAHDISDKLLTKESADDACKLLEGFVGHEVTEDFKTFWDKEIKNG